MQNTNNSSGCFPSVHAKIFEIILIIGFSISAIVLLINLIITMWFFKFSTSLLIIEIVLLILNVATLILSIILRIWRSNGSVFNITYSSSNCLALLVIILILINFLCTIAEEVIFYFVYSFFSLQDEVEELMMKMEMVDYDDYYMDYEQHMPSQADIDKILELQKKYKKAEKTLYKIMNKVGEDKGQDYGDNPDKKLKLLKIIPWICLNFNLLIQITTFIIIIIVKQRITLKNDFGTSSHPNNLSSRLNQIGNNRNTGFLTNISNNNHRRNINKRIKSKNKKNNKGRNNELESGKIKIVSKKSSSKTHSRKKKK